MPSCSDLWDGPGAVGETVLAELGTAITDVVLNIIAFASDVPEMSKMPGFVEFDIWSIVAAWEYDGWRSQFTLHRLIV